MIIMFNFGSTTLYIIIIRKKKNLLNPTHKELQNQYKAYSFNRRWEPKIEVSSSLVVSEDNILDKLVQNASLVLAIRTADSTTCFWCNPPLRNVK